MFCFCSELGLRLVLLCVDLLRVGERERFWDKKDANWLQPEGSASKRRNGRGTGRRRRRIPWDRTLDCFPVVSSVVSQQIGVTIILELATSFSIEFFRLTAMKFKNDNL